MLFTFMKQWVIGGLSFIGSSADKMKMKMEAMPIQCVSRFVKLETRRNLDLQ